MVERTFVGWLVGGAFIVMWRRWWAAVLVAAAAVAATVLGGGLSPRPMVRRAVCFGRRCWGGVV
jgi:O-antigen ligase